MENEKRVRIISLVAVIVAVIGLTLAFAAMSRTLKINGRGSVDPANFDIYFDNLSNPVTNGQATTSGSPQLATKGAEISNINVTLKQPKDSVTYTVDIVNEGDVDAEISNITLPTLTARQNELFEFTAEYTSEQENGSKAIAVGDMLYKNESKNITITFKYKDITDESKLPSNPEEITLSYAIEYVQSNKTKTTTAAPSYGEEIASTSLGNGIEATYYGGTPIAKADSGVMAMSNDNKLADDVRYEGGTLVISGSGTIPGIENGLSDVHLFLFDVSSENDVFSNPQKYLDYETETFLFKYNPTNLVIEEGITNIGSRVFVAMKSLVNVSLPNTLVGIGDYAFEGCISIVNMSIPSSVKILRDCPFANDPETSVSSIILNEGLERIEYQGLSGLSMTSIMLPSTVNYLGHYAFEGAALEEVYISSDNIQIDGRPFSTMPNLKKIYVKNQTVKNLIINSDSSLTDKVIVDPTKFN